MFFNMLGILFYSSKHVLDPPRVSSDSEKNNFSVLKKMVLKMKNGVWEVVPRLEGKSVVTSKWLYKIKDVADGSIEKYKARFVARRFSQVEEVDYDETFASVARFSSIRAVISIMEEMVWRIHQMDAKTTFLNGLLQEEVYSK